MNRFLKILFVLYVSFLLSCSGGGGGGSTQTYHYHTPDEVESYLDGIVSAHGDIAALDTVGYSTDGRVIKALIISNNPTNAYEDEPRVRISGGIHGNEKVTVDMMLRLADYLVSIYGTESSITDLINSRYIVIIPVINPDGLAANTRYNVNGVDLNRNFDSNWSSSDSHPGSGPFSEIESQAIRDYSLSKVFHSSLTFHSGTVIVNMPFDYMAEHDLSVPYAPVENSLVRAIGLVYTTSGSFLDNPDVMDGVYVDRGTINGGDWYKVHGSMQDWSYLKAGCIDYTVEVSDIYAPASVDEVEDTYLYNRDSIIAYIKHAGYGVHGRVTDSVGNPVGGVKISAIYSDSTEGDLHVYTDSQGYYHRILLPGTYTLTFSKSGYDDTTAPHTVTIPDSSSGLQYDISLTPQ